MDDNKLREIFASIADVEPLSDGWPVLSKFANAVLAAADAEAVPEQPVAHIHRSNNNEVNVFFAGGVCPIDGNSVSQEMLKSLPLNKSVPLYVRPQPADVGVLVEALKQIMQAHTWQTYDIASKAIAEWEAKR